MERHKSDEELKEIAKDLYAGKIYSDRQIDNVRDIPIVFMPLAFPNDTIRKDVESLEIFFIYEYIEKAFPRSINGMPMFGSFSFLNKLDFEKMVEYYKKIEKAMNEI